MANSYNRNCVNCGRRIQMRQMPAGQWLPFEGYDTVHVCSSSAPNRNENARAQTTSTSKRSAGSGYNDLEFLQFSLPADSIGNESATRAANKVRGTQNTSRKRPPTTSRTHFAQKRHSYSDVGDHSQDTFQHTAVEPVGSANYIKAFVVLAALALIVAHVVFYRRATNGAPVSSSTVASHPTPASSSSPVVNSLSAWAYYEQGVELTKARKYSEAAEAYIQALSRDSKMAKAHHELGYTYTKLCQWDKAAASFREAVALQPDAADSYRLLGDTLVMLEKWNDAIQAYNQAIALEPESVPAYLGVASSYRHLNQLEEAANTYLKLIEVKPKNATAHYQLGLLYLDMGDRDKAADEHEQLLPLNAKLAERLSQKISEFSQLEIPDI